MICNRCGTNARDYTWAVVPVAERHVDGAMVLDAPAAAELTVCKACAATLAQAAAERLKARGLLVRLEAVPRKHVQVQVVVASVPLDPAERTAVLDAPNYDGAAKHFARRLARVHGDIDLVARVVRVDPTGAEVDQPIHAHVRGRIVSTTAEVVDAVLDGVDLVALLNQVSPPESPAEAAPAQAPHDAPAQGSQWAWRRAGEGDDVETCGSCGGCGDHIPTGRQCSTCGGTGEVPARDAAAAQPEQGDGEVLF